MKFRKKPVVVDAVQTSIIVKIKTLEGEMTAQPEDWIITGVNGEKYPCKPDVFAKTYERVGDGMSDNEFVNVMREIWKSAGNNHVLAALIENWAYNKPKLLVALTHKLDSAIQ